MPACYITNHIGLSNIGEGEENPIMLLLRDEIDELQIKLNKCDVDIPDIQQALIDVETAYVNTSLTEPINNPDACYPSTVNKAKLSIYWAEWLVTMYEELESLKAKGIYEEVDELPPGRKPVGCKWVLHIKHDKDFKITCFKA